METNKKPIIIIALFLIIAIVIIFIVLTINKDRVQVVQTESSNKENKENLVANSKPNGTESLATETKPNDVNNSADNGNNVSREKIQVAPETTSNQVAPETTLKKNNESVAMNEENSEEGNKTPIPENLPNLQQRMEATSPISGVLKIKVADNAFNPMTFYVEAGAKVNISLTNTNELKHTITFKDPSLANINISVDGGKTKDVSFNAPSSPGTYYFYCATDNHEANGEMGKMIVK